VDALTLDGLIREIAPAFLGRHLVRVRAAEAHAILLEPASAREPRLWLDAGRLAPGLYALSRDDTRAARDESALAGAARQAVLLLRKHLEGRRISGLRRVPGARAVVLDASGIALVLRLGTGSALTLAVEGRAVATIGPGEPAWPPPPDAPEREWDRIRDATLAAAIDEARAAGRSTVRAVLDACPGLGPAMARLAAQGGGLSAFREALARPHPVLIAPRPLHQCDDADLARADALTLLPLVPPAVEGLAIPQPTWTAAVAALLLGRLRGARFERRRRAVVEAADREARRAAQLLAHLEDDRRALPPAEGLRRQAEALLAAPDAAGAGPVVEVPDPYAAGSTLRITIDAGAGLRGSADRLFAKARRIERAVAQVEARLVEVRATLDRTRAAAAAARAARSLADLAPLGAPETGGGRPRDEPRGLRHYLSSRGLSILVGRGGRENHRLTFAVAGPDDLWLHAREVPGAHVILRDPEGRATAEDRREAAELAAFFSGAAAQGQVDVHVTPRKHVRATRGGAGRVVVGQSETLRVRPRDPEGRLRRRPGL
jgi:hypothetical protein